jgi:hypothetical protein
MARPTAILSMIAASIFLSGLLFIGYRLPRISAFPMTLPRHYVGTGFPWWRSLGQFVTCKSS